jgi:hypothetical protein
MSWKWNTAGHFSLESRSTPEKIGPGTYDPEGPEASRSPSACFQSRDPRDLSHRAFKTPAPGAYEQDSPSSRFATTSPFRSISRRDYFISPDNPGPADYTPHPDASPKSTPRVPHSPARDRPVSGNIGQALGYEISDAGEIRPVKRPVYGSGWVGPGSYSPDAHSTSRKHSMNESYRDCLYYTDPRTPGPGTYTIHDSPSRYPTRIHERTAPDHSELTSGCDLRHKSWAPSPSRGDSSAFRSKTERRAFGDLRETPGPATYQPVREHATSPSCVAFGQGSPRFAGGRSDTPGPGQYEVRSPSRVTRSAASGSRSARRWAPATDVPGPGTYGGDVNDRGQTRPSSAFASASRRSCDVREGPGPGTYDIDATRRSQQRSMHAGRSQYWGNYMENPFQDNPSPDAYDVSREMHRSGKSFPRTVRFEGQKEAGPGPGTYDVTHSSLVKKSYHTDFLQKPRSDRTIC